ncbi:hypothetical protein C882_1235 [Caenispirillum salinarum AK4]|uniref:Uncharacterized protein n=1 Tax=Caenispirillum salinarum AK4 TaxID=1238182 RepID=K9GU15_9PROT|nr:hypothetical protein C882_1235 [Caenispirillum salinarum AK4]
MRFAHAILRPWQPRPFLVGNRCGTRWHPSAFAPAKGLHQ